MRRITTVGIALASVSLLLAACGGDSGSSSTTTSAAATGSETSAPAETSGGSSGGASELTVWADASANTAKAIKPLCQQWAEENGVTCTVKEFAGPAELDDAITKGNASGDVPDVFEAPHNGIGRMVTNGILAPVDLGTNAANLVEPAVAGVTYEGSTYGVPWATENIALLTNKALSPACPATLDEAVANAKALIAAGTVTSGLGIALQIGDNGDGYHWYPLFSADGGYAFKQNEDGSFDPADMGIGQQGSIEASKRLQQLVADGILKASVTYDIARESFAGGKSPYFITGPWQIPEQSAALADNLMVCPVPNWEGSQYTSQPFLGVRTFFQPAKAPNPTLASTFLADEVLTTEFMDGMYEVDPRIPAWKETLETASADPYTKAFGEYGVQGIPMPNIQQMDNLFLDWGLAEFKIASGSEPEATIAAAGDAINKLNASLN